MFLPNRLPSLYVALFAAALCPAMSAPSSAQSSDEQTAAFARALDPCKDADARKQWDNATSPVYADAMELARTLNNRGFVLECVRRSKEEHLFPHQKGAAWYKTARGVFEVWFLPITDTFAALNVVEKQEPHGQYAYSFRGNPRILTEMDSSKPISFIKRGNKLFEVWGNKQLAASIEKAFPQP